MRATHPVYDTHTHTLANAFILGKGTSRIRAPL